VVPATILRSEGVWDFLQAAQYLRNEGVDAVFALVGGAQPSNRGIISEREIKEWCAAGWVELWGRQDDIRTVYRRADIVCLPSRGGESTAKELLEVMASGLPIVTSDVPVCRDVVRDGWNGLIVPPGSPHDLAAALYRLIADPNKRRSYGINGRKSAEQRFGLERVITRYLELYDQMILATGQVRLSTMMIEMS
jgi:glycosyltransferase involved in cell wall biosynthesis